MHVFDTPTMTAGEAGGFPMGVCIGSQGHDPASSGVIGRPMSDGGARIEWQNECQHQYDG